MLLKLIEFLRLGPSVHFRTSKPCNHTGSRSFGRPAKSPVSLGILPDRSSQAGSIMETQKNPDCLQIYFHCVDSSCDVRR